MVKEKKIFLLDSVSDCAQIRSCLG